MSFAAGRFRGGAHRVSIFSPPKLRPDRGVCPTMRSVKALFIVPILAFAVTATHAQVREGEDATSLQSEPQSVAGGVDVSAAPAAQTSESGIEYRTGGIGKDERDALHLAAARYPLKVVLSARDGAFVADASIDVTEKAGKSVFAADPVGPLVFVDLPPGSYTVAVTSRGETKKQTVSLAAKKQKAISFNW